jgi:aminocarboxymuconate-semialdehyde decarboxylase
MRKRREFIKTMAGAAGALMTGGELVSVASAQAPAAAPASRVGRVMVGGRRVRVIDVHCHWNVPGLPALNPNTAGRGGAAGGRGGGGGRGGAGGGRGGGAAADPVATRLALMDARGVDIGMLSVNGFNWYDSDDRALVSRYMAAQDEGLSAVCKANPTRFVAVSSPSLQFPDLAAQQLERAMKELGLKGASVGGHCRGESLSDAKYDPFWAKCEQLQALVFMHPGGAENVLQDDAWQETRGDLGNIIGNPLESTVFVSRLIYDGTLDKFPKLKICVAHAGGYLSSYLGRSDAACQVRGNANCANKRQFRQYFRDQVMVDTMIFSDEGLRHLVAEMGAGQIMYGTDMAFNWPDGIDEVLRADYLSNDQKEAILGGTLARLLKI